MITAVIVLLVIALALGGYIAFDILHGKNHVPRADNQSVATEPQPKAATAVGETAPQSVEQPAPKARSHAKEEENKIAQNISGKPETAAADQRGDAVAETKPAVECKQIPPSEVRTEVAATDVDSIMSDEVAESLIEKSVGTIDKTKQGIVNIDTLSQYFESGEMVTLDEIKKRVKGFNQRTTYIKVLARGTLSKALTVEADNFSIQAVKMIVLTGGKAIKKQSK
ncbi:MAG: uL15 family ribosomal protein [Clostridiales bacterium]|nr:uL15 family ribosomal protein [Clostridiales bacterium]